jgi:hypothetical protein
MYKIPVSSHIARAESRAQVGTINNDMPYNDYNHLPIPTNYVTPQQDFGYSFLPPEKWYPQPPNPPICVSEKECPVCPIYTGGTDLSAMQWNDSLRVTPPDNINTSYVTEKLNSGR